MICENDFKINYQVGRTYLQSFHGSGRTVAGFHRDAIRRAAEYVVIFLLFKEKDRTRVKLCSIGILLAEQQNDGCAVD